MATLAEDSMELDKQSVGSSEEESDSEAPGSNEQSDAEESDEEMVEKDDTEDELERLVFGDNAGFKDALKSRGREEDQAAQDKAGDGLALAGDSDLFFLDSGPDQTLAPPADINDLERRAPAAWEDSDDDRMMVSLESVPRLKKLRRYEGEDVISGREYQKRLRQQFELLNPRPKWAQQAVEANNRKRRRGSTNIDGGSESDESDGDLSTKPLAKLLRNNASLSRGPQQTSNKRPKLRPDMIPIERMKDISPTQPSAIESISIHPTMPLVLSSGPSSTVYLHSLNPHPVPPDPANPLITSLHLKHTPLTTSLFAPAPRIAHNSRHSKDLTQPNADPTQAPKIYLSSRRRYFHIWSLATGHIQKISRIHGHSTTQKSMEVLKPSPCGRYIALLGSSRKAGGVVNILDANTSFWIAQVAVESGKGVADFEWWGDGEGLVVAGRGGECTEYSTAERQVLGRWQDEGAVGVTTIAMGGRSAEHRSGKKRKKLANGEASIESIGPDRWIAVGSTSGIVNLYERGDLLSSMASTSGTAHPKPYRTLDNLTTPISHLHFSPCGQVLAMASRWKKDALRLVQLPSAAVYRNWPTSKTPLGRVSAVCLGEYDVEGKGGDGVKKIVLITGNEQGVLRGWEIGD